jgi:hypothetical protein
LLEAILLVAGAIAGLIADRLWRMITEKSSSLIHRLRILARTEADRSAQAAIVSHYQAAGLLASLYVTRTLPNPQTVAVLRDPSANDVGPIPLTSDEFLVVDDPARQKFDVDDRIIASRRRVGRLWDGAVLYVSGREADPLEPGRQRTIAGVCNYYSYVTLSDRILQAYLQGQHGDAGTLQGLSSFSMAVSGCLKPITISGAAACVFDSQNGHLVVVHRRSDDVISSRGLLGLTPLYGMESNVTTDERSQFGVIGYNFLKEFLEELYGEVETERTDISRALHPDWMFGSARAQALISQFDNGNAELKVLGSCIDCSDGTYTFVIMAHFHDAAFLEQFKFESRAGWELQALADGGRPFSLLPVLGSELEALAVPETMSATSIFALDLVRESLARSLAADMRPLLGSQ